MNDIKFKNLRRNATEQSTYNKIDYFFIDNILVGKNVIPFQDLPRNKKIGKIRDKLYLVQYTVKKQSESLLQ